MVERKVLGIGVWSFFFEDDFLVVGVDREVVLGKVIMLFLYWSISKILGWVVFGFYLFLIILFLFFSVVYLIWVVWVFIVL